MRKVVPGTNTDVKGLGSFIWSIAEILRGDFKQSEYGKVILPFIVLRRLDCLLDASKRDVLVAAKGLSDAVDDPTRDMILFAAAGENIKVYNLSAFTFESLKAQDPGQLHDNLIDYITKFSGNVRDIFLDKFIFTEQLKRLNEGGIWRVEWTPTGPRHQSAKWEERAFLRQTGGSEMKTSRTVVGVDTAKRVFQLHWVDMETGEIVDLKLTRAKFLEHFANRVPCVGSMEACGGSQHWARKLREIGHDPWLLPERPPGYPRDRTYNEHREPWWLARDKIFAKHSAALAPIPDVSDALHYQALVAERGAVAVAARNVVL